MNECTYISHTAGEDYTPALELLAFQVGSEDGFKQCVNISILEDTDMEKTSLSICL